MNVPVRTLACLDADMRAGHHVGAQVFAEIDGETVIDLAIGAAAPEIPMTVDTIVEWASATKAITASAIALLWQRGLIDPDDTVAHHIPEFSANGKDAVTIRHLLTHTSGITSTTSGVESASTIVSRICALPLADNWVPGQRCAYNSAGMWILAEIVERISGRGFPHFVRDEICVPLGLEECWIGIPNELFDIVRHRMAVIPGFARSGTREWATWQRPTGGCHGPIRNLGRFYSALMRGNVVSAPILAEMCRPQLQGVRDGYLDATVDRGLGFLLRSSRLGHSYGPHASSRTYGHGGRDWCVGFADPAHQVAVAVYWNGVVSRDVHDRRQPRLLAAVYEDLGLT